MRVDVHAHYFPWAYIDRINELFPKHAALFGGGRPQLQGRPASGGDTTAEISTRLDLMDEAGIDMQILSAASYLPYLDDEALAIGLARQCNDAYAALVSAHPTRFRAYAVLPLPHVDASLNELERAFDELDMIGVAIGSSVMARESCDPDFEPLYEEMNRRGAVVFGHALQCGLYSPLIEPFWSLNSASIAIENGMFGLHMINRRVPQRFPQLKVIVPHLGGTMPFLADRFDRFWHHYPHPYPGDDPALSEPPSQTMRRMWYDSVYSFDGAAFRVTHDLVGVERILLGSDYPALTVDLKTAVSDVQGNGLPQADLDRILDQNAARLLELF
jgi:aminocarboxymuconate-semialdehyde decarboxylase